MTGQSITFGWHLDGQCPMLPHNTIGISTVGPLGLLSILESRLGLVAPQTSQAERVAQYQTCLQAFNNKARFYHRSFATDPLGTAACLLRWRDEWALHGWDGTLPANAPKRLRDLADVEALAHTSVSPNIAQRLNTVQTTLQRRSPGIDQLCVIDPADSFPLSWQKVLDALPCHYHAEPAQPGKGFLGRLQSQLEQAIAGQQPASIAWCDDGTVKVVRAETSLLAAQWLATQLDAPSTLLVATNQGPELDASLAALGHARHGFKEASALRPALQVLPLAMDLLWDPLNFDALLKFLTHPICPVRRYARLRLADKLAQAPGIGGSGWVQALNDIGLHYDDTTRQKVHDQINQWVEHPRFDATIGAPRSAVIAKVEQLAAFFRVRLGESDPVTQQGFAAGYAQCQACLASLLTLNTEFIRPRQLQKLVAQATGSGTVNPQHQPEVGSGPMVSHPGAVFQKMDRVIWWHLAMPALPGASTWSEVELNALKQVGVLLPDAATQLERLAKAWLQPVLRAREQLILMLPPPGIEVHPLWQMVNAVVEKPTIIELENLLVSGEQTMRPFNPLPLPAPKRWWQLANGVKVGPRTRESFSSLELLLHSPYRWLLRYHANIQPGRLYSLHNTFALRGTLAHGLIEEYFLHPQALNMNQTDFERWFETHFERRIDQEGALWRMPGNGVELENLRHTLRQALDRLRRHMKESHITQVTPEQALEGQFQNQQLAGTADLIVQTTQKHFGIIDMKWSGSKKYAEKLKKNSHLQLAIYAELFRQKYGQTPAVAFYIMDTARLIAPDKRLFTDAKHIASSNDENTAQLWSRFLQTWNWRVQQIQNGLFEVSLESIDPTEDSSPPAEGLATEYLNEVYDEYITLTGWKD